MATLAQINKTLDKIYAPQLGTLKQQGALLDQTAAAESASIEQAKVNAFRNVAETANSRGMLFSGFKPAEEARYLGEHYLPGKQKLAIQTQQNKLSLLDTMNKLKATQYQQAQDMFRDDRTFGENRRQFDKQHRLNMLQFQQSKKDKAAEMRFRQQELAISRQAAAASQARARTSAASQGPPSPTQFLAQSFSGYKPASEGGTPWYTEREIIPGLMATYNIPQAQAAKIAYDYRKRVFNE